MPQAISRLLVFMCFHSEDVSELQAHIHVLEQQCSTLQLLGEGSQTVFRGFLSPTSHTAAGCQDIDDTKGGDDRVAAVTYCHRSRPYGGAACL